VIYKVAIVMVTGWGLEHLSIMAKKDIEIIPNLPMPFVYVPDAHALQLEELIAPEKDNTINVIKDFTSFL
jgi:hypothetical protein